MKPFPTWLACVLVICGTLIANAQPPPDNTLVEIESGKITGLIAGETGDVRIYKGVPYAAPPVGDNRWREPQPCSSWNGVLACQEFKGAPPQASSATSAFGPLAGRIDENCLYVNVFTPAKTSNEALPVMVWFFGGGFSRGDASFYDMERLARRGAVIVTVSFRVGVMGFLAHETLTKESPHGVSGNYAIHDMIAALRWVQRNITAFGGEPKNVTVFGQSSGASAVIHLMASPRTAALFHRAIAQSNGAYNPDTTLREMEKSGATLFTALGLPNDAAGLAAARAKPWEEIVAANEKASREHAFRFGLAIDGWLFSNLTSEIFAQGKQQPVPLLIGSNANESDSEYTASARYYARQQSAVTPNVYRYFFTQPTKDPRFAGKGAVHSSEIPYMLGGNSRLDAHWDERDRALTDKLTSMWIQFARTGNPNTENAALTWPRY